MNNLSKIQKRIIIIVVILVIGIIGYYIYGRENTPQVTTEEETIMKKEENTEDKKREIIVHITGAVQKEGVYTLKENSRVADAVTSAGGLTEDADMSKVNLAYILEDGVKINIPSKNDTEEDEYTEDAQFVENIYSDSGTGGKKMDLVNINKATQTELETLPGVGPSTALKIINYREENGPFSNIEDLKSINGIGESKYEKIKDSICVK